MLAIGHDELFRYSIILLLALLLSPRALCETTNDADLQFFETRIRPVLAERCYTCHSATAKKLKGNLFTDTRDGLLKGGDNGPALVPGHADQSRLITAINYGDVDLQMPPKGKLTDAQIADLTAWVNRGAPWPTSDKPPSSPTKPAFDLQQRKASHWAWRSIQTQTPPSVHNTTWPRSPIDAFILAKLEAQHLLPAPPADRATLLRRVNFDLIGLPPTAAELQAFTDDPSPNAFEKVVDRLLASSHFGERWARHWLDLVRFAETHGHEFDYPIPNAWQYRDYVVRAFNADLPYDQFLTEQIAGDLLPHPRLNPHTGANESILGTAVYFLGEEVQSPVDIRQDEADRMNSRLDTLTKAFQGLTVGCARCHDHKFDAISARDHYALTGILLGGSYRQTLFESEPHNRAVATELQHFREQIRPRLLKLAADAYRSGLARAAARLRDVNVATANPEPAAAQTIVDYAQPNAGFWQDGFTFGLAPAKAGDLDLGSESAPVFGLVTRPAAHRDAAWPDVKAIHAEIDTGKLASFERPGRTFRTPKVTLKTGQVRILLRGDAHAYAAVDTHVLIEGPLHGDLLKTFHTHGEWRWAEFDLTPYAGQRAELEFSPVGSGRLDVAKVIETDGTTPPIPDSAPSGDLAATLAELASGQVTADHAPLADWMLRHPDAFTSRDDPARLALDAAVRDAQHQQAEIVRRVQIESHAAPAVLDGNGVDEHVLIRGVARNPGELVPRRFLEAIAGSTQSTYPFATSGRLQLAEAMLRPDDPFTARVMANRVWQHLFGAGIVPTVDNFGVLGQPPSHPELLDYLADEFRDSQSWSIKKLIRSIVLTRTYQSASLDDPNTTELAERVDPQDQLLHHMPVRRLEAEAIRDAILAVSGRLDPSVGGPPVEVYLTPFMEGRGRPQTSGPLDGDGRRSIYIKVRRNFIPPMMLAFDTPTPFATVGRRSVSNVPAQALILMNDPFVVQQAHVWARRVLTEREASDADRIKRMYVDAFARPPTAQELADVTSTLADLRHAYGTTDANDERPWADVAHVLFNAKEFIFVR